MNETQKALPTLGRPSLMSLTSGLSLCGAERRGGSMSSECCIAVGGRGLISNILSLCPNACETVYVSILCSENTVVVNTNVATEVQ